MGSSIGANTSRLMKARKFVTASFSVSSQRSFAVSSCTKLYTKEALGLSGYEKTRERTATQLGNMKGRFKERMDQYLGADSKSLIFTEDLKNMLYLAEDEKDLEMIEKMMKKYAKQNEQVKFGSFVFGPVLMRMYYHLGKTETALASFKNEETASMYDQLTSYQILMDLLYESQRYDDVLQVYEILMSRPFLNGKLPRECLVLATASCYKIGTQEAYQKVLQMIKATVDANAQVMRKAVAFAAALALKNNDTAGALEILAVPQNQGYVTIRNLKALALTKMDRLEDVLPLLRSVLDQDTSFQRRIQPSFFSDVVKEIREAVDKKDDVELKQEFEKVFKSLEAGSHMDKSTLEEFLERPIEEYIRQDRNPDGSFNQNSAYQNRGGRFQQDSSQQGLRQPRYRDDYQSQQQEDGGGRYNQSGGRYGQSRYSGGGSQGGSYGSRISSGGGGGGGGYEDRSESGGSSYTRPGTSQYSSQGSAGSQGGDRYSRGGYGRQGSDGGYQSGGGRRDSSGLSEGSEGRGGSGGYERSNQGGYRGQGQGQGGYRARPAARQGLQDLDD